jgi:PAS domain S-box-containing protein
MPQLRQLQAITALALRISDRNELLNAIVDNVTQHFRVDTVALLLLEGEELAVRAARGPLDEEVKQSIRIPPGPGFEWKILRKGVPLVIPDLSREHVHSPIVRAAGVRSLVGVPLRLPDRLIGVLHLGSVRPRQFTDDEMVLLQLIGDRVSLAIAFHDLHERLSREGARLRAFVESTAQLMWTAEPDGRFVDEAAISRWCMLTGQKPDEARGSGWVEAIHPDDRPRIEAAWNRTITNVEKYDVEYRVRYAADGR